jgi:hemerythrin-like domain-containing protein
MPIQIGRKPESFFNNPLGMLSDCHRRIERFLYILITVVRQTHGNELSEEQRGAMECALRYFREAAPNHVRDEEESLFPRLREKHETRVATVFERMAELEAEHEMAERTHLEADALGRRWLADGRLSVHEADRFAELVSELSRVYHRHIHVEEVEVYPMAGLVLEPSVVETIGREMAQRRDIDVDFRTAYHL